MGMPAVYIGFLLVILSRCESSQWPRRAGSGTVPRQIRRQEPLCSALGADKLSEAVFLVPGTPQVTNLHFPAEP